MTICSSSVAGTPAKATATTRGQPLQVLTTVGHLLVDKVSSESDASVAFEHGDGPQASFEVVFEGAGRQHGDLVRGRRLREGERLAPGDVVSKRPGTGISPAELPRVLGLRLTRDVAADEVISWEALARS